MTSREDPSFSSRPWLSSATVSHMAATDGSEWETMTTVRPPARSSSKRCTHLRWNASSPTASTSSTSRMSGSTLMATAKPRRTYMPEE